MLSLYRGLNKGPSDPEADGISMRYHRSLNVKISVRLGQVDSELVAGKVIWKQLTLSANVDFKHLLIKTWKHKKSLVWNRYLVCLKACE